MKLSKVGGREKRWKREGKREEGEGMGGRKAKGRGVNWMVVEQVLQDRSDLIRQRGEKMDTQAIQGQTD